MSMFNRNDKPNDIQQNPQAAQPQAAQQKIETAAPKPAEPSPPVPTVKPSPTPAKTGVIMASVISKALKITGELESTEDIQIDGQIEGDVRGVGVKIGQNAKVKGTVYGDEVELAGSIEGKIEAKKVILAGTARMTGDVWHQDIKIESGAYMSGNLKPELGKSDAKPAPKPAAAASVSPLNANPATGTAHH
jgi:cytoskeletal protein CcmA (bactofilin family)